MISAVPEITRCLRLPQAGLTARDQVMCDLAHLFDVVMRTYKPAVAAAGKPQTASLCACNAAGPCECRSEDPTACLPQMRLVTLPADVQARAHVSPDVPQIQCCNAVAACTNPCTLLGSDACVCPVFDKCTVFVQLLIFS